MATPTQRANIVRFGLFEADLEQRVLVREGLRVKLQDQPFEILTLLLQRPGEIITREEIQQKLWPADTYVAFDDGLNTAIKKLRLALRNSAENPSFIETVPRRGYRFLAFPVFAETTASAPGPGKDAKVPSAAATGPAPDKNSESDVLKPGRRRPALLWAGLVVAGVFSVTGLIVWREHIVRGASQSAALKSQPSNFPAGRHVDPRAHEEYLQARGFWKLRTAEALTKALDHYNLAIDFAPDYAEAYAGLANSYIVLPMLTTVSTEDAYLKARQAAEKAIALDDSLAQGHLAEAEIKLYCDWDFRGAEKEFRRALERDANDAQSHQWYAEFLSLMGRHHEAIAQIQTAEHLDPSSMIIHHQAGQVFQAARMYPSALQEYRQALMIQPGFGPTYSVMALAYLREGRYFDYVNAERQANQYWDPGGTAIKDLQTLADAYQTGGKRAFLRAKLEFSKKHPARPYQFSQEYARLGDSDQALLWLDKTLDVRHPDILNLRNDPEFDRLRSDLRYRDIVTKVGFPPIDPVVESQAKR
jgi:DNA-binding winged helix-turn-helix (wHTH) protein